MTLLHQDQTQQSPEPEQGGITPATPPTTTSDRLNLGPVGPRRKLRGASRDEVLAVVGALAASLCITVLLFGRLAAFSGLIGFVIIAYVSFVVVYLWLLSQREDTPAVKDAVATVVLYSAGLVVLVALFDVVFFTVKRGLSALVHVNFFTQDLSRAGSLSPLTSGGIKHAIVGTLWMISIALVITIPLGLLCAVYLNQVATRFSRFVRTLVEAMTALPSIVAGLFIYAVWEISLHRQKSGLAAAFALSVMMLPIIIRASDVVLRLVPGNLKEASAALGAPTWRTVWHVVLPTARSGLATAIILGTARGIGETSPVLLTAGYTTYLNSNPTKGPMVSLPLAAFKLVSSPQPTQVARGFGAAAFLLLLVIALFAIARTLGGRGPGNLTKRQRQRAVRRSGRDAARFQALEDSRLPSRAMEHIVREGAAPP